MKSRVRKIIFLLAVTAVIVFAACRKDQSLQTTAGKQSVTILINDNPVRDLTNVWIDIRHVEIKVDTTRKRPGDDDDDDYDDDDDDDDDDRDHDRYGIWDTLGVAPGVYDLLRFRNGIDTVLATGLATSGRIFKVRLTLGPNSATSKDSGVTRQALGICNRKPYVYIRIRKEHLQVQNGTVRLQLDFDLSKSLNWNGGRYCLRPVVKAYSDRSSGKIEGEVRPRIARAMPFAFNSTDSSGAKPDDDGEFKICGLKPGVYSLRFNPVNGYRDTIITGIVVRAGQEVELPTITLRR